MNINKKLSLGFLSIVSLFSLAVAPAFAATTTVVYPGDMHGWTFAQEDTAVGTGALVEGPAPTPLGTGSAQLTVDSTGREILYTLDYAGTRLDSLNTLQYSTYSQTTTTTLAPALQLNVDYDLTDSNTSWQGRLVFEPYMNGTVTSGEWQSWSPLDGLWWATGNPGKTLCPQDTPCTWTQILAAFPNAGISATSGQVLFKVGQWAGGYVGNVDAFTINDTTYDFESQYTPPVVAPTTKNDCKNQGWSTYTTPTFKNQGKCISFVNHL